MQPVAPLSFEIDEEDRFIDEKYDLLDLNGLPPESTCAPAPLRPPTVALPSENRLRRAGRWLVAEMGENPPAELLAFLRLKHLGAADAFLLEPVFLDALWPEHLQYPISEENERAALTDFAACCSAALASFGGSVQSDLQTLAEADGASRDYALASVRYAERRALEAASRAVETRLGALRNLEYYQQRRLNALGLQPVETEEEIDALRAGGRQYSASDYGDW